MTHSQIHILLVDDDEEDRELVAAALSRTAEDAREHHVDCVTTLNEGMDALRSGIYEVVLLDITLSGNRGIETLRRVRQNFPDIAIIVITHLDDERLAREAVAHGAQDYLVKRSFNGHHLKRSIAYAMERNLLLQKLERSTEERFRYLIEKSADGMVIVDREGVVRFINPAVEAIFDRNAEEIVGHKFDFHKLSKQDGDSGHDLGDLSIKYVSLLAKTGKTTELEITCEEDLVRLVEMRATEVQWELKPAYMVVFHDITSLIRLQRLKAEVFERERVAKLKDEFISTVSHELRTPLAIVKCAIENMKDGVTGLLSDKQEKIVRIASSNVDRLTKLIDDILDLSRLEAGTVKIARRPMSLEQLVSDTIRRFALLAKEHGIALEYDVPFNLPIIYADIDKITQVLDNLLSNALRYAKNRVVLKAESISGAVSASGGDGGGRFQEYASSVRDGVKVSIVDDGQGIPEDKVGHLFNKFVQIDRPTGGAGYKGTGLGLAICKEIIELHDGKIWAESRFGDGAQFHFILPQYQENHGMQDSVP